MTTHPVQAGLRGVTSYLVARLIELCTIAVILTAGGVLVLNPETPVSLAAALVVLLALLEGVRRSFWRAAWDEVPGAFGMRSIWRGDRLEKRRLAPVDLAWKILDTAVMIAGGYLLTHLGHAHAAYGIALVGAVGGLGLGWFAVSAACGLWSEPFEPWVDRLRLSQLVVCGAWWLLASGHHDASGLTFWLITGLVTGLMIAGLRLPSHMGDEGSAGCPE